MLILCIQVDCLDLNTMTWSQLGPMTTHRHGLGVAVLHGPLYAIGGHDGEIYYDIFHRSFYSNQIHVFHVRFIGWSYLNTVERYSRFGWNNNF